MKYFSLILGWVAGCALAVFCSSASLIKADPADDFSFTLAPTPKSDVYHLMSDRRVAEILKDRLDLFPKSQAPKLARHIVSLCAKHRFDPSFILSLIEVESSFRVRAVSPMGAVGLMQLMPGTAAVVAKMLRIPPVKARALTDPFVNITLGITYLAWLRDRYQGLSPYYLVAAYNAGPGKIDEVLLRKNFKPVQTKKYFDDIRRAVPSIRFYQRGERVGARLNKNRSKVGV